MRELRWQILIAVGGLLLVVGLLLRQTPTIQSVSPEPVSGGSHVEALIGSPVRLNPVLDFNNQVDEDVDRLIYRGLVRFDSHGNPVPDLAEQVAVSADARLYTVTLREGLTWHDGEPVISDDVVYTFSRFKEEGYPGPPDLREFWADINIIQLDEHTVQFELPEPFAPFPDTLSVGLLPDHLLRGVSSADLPDHPFSLEPVGTGPFRFEQFMAEGEQISGVSLTAFEDFHRGEPFLDRVEFRYFDSGDAAWDTYRAEKVQAIGSVTDSILGHVLDTPALDLHSARLPRVKTVYLNLNHGEKTFFSESPVRQALMLGINRQALVDQVMNGQAVVATGPVLPGTWAFAQELEPLPYDPIQATEQLDTLDWELPAGTSPGDEDYVRTNGEQELSFTMLHVDSAEDRAVASMLQMYWAQLGVEVTLQAVEPEQLLTALEERDYQSALTEITLSRWPDPDPYMLWHDSQAQTGQNYAGFDDRNIGIWLERSRTNPDRGRRAELYQNFQYRFQDLAPALLLYHPVYNYAIRAEMQGVRLGPLTDPSDRFAMIEEWHLLTRRNTTQTTEVPTEIP